MEAVVVSSLLGTFGYLLSRENKENKENVKTIINKSEEPSVNNTYSSDKFNNTIEKVINKNNKVYNKSLESKSNTIPINKKHIETNKKLITMKNNNYNNTIISFNLRFIRRK